MNFRQKINFKQLRCFQAVAEHGSFTAAAHALVVGQPSITTHVRALEENFGVELFCRHGHQVELTYAGRGLLAVSQRIFSLENQAAEILNSAGGLYGGNLSIGAISAHQMTRNIVAFSQQYPQVDLSVSFGNSSEVLSGVLEFQLDVAMLPNIDDDPRLLSMPFSHTRVVLLVSRENPWAQQEEITIQELEGQRMVLRELGSATRKVFEDALDQAAVNIRCVLEIESPEAVREAVASGIGIGIALKDEIQSDDRVSILRVSNASMSLEPQIVCLRERCESPLIKAFLELTQSLHGNKSG